MTASDVTWLKNERNLRRGQIRGYSDPPSYEDPEWCAHYDLDVYGCCCECGAQLELPEEEEPVEVHLTFDVDGRVTLHE